MGDGNATTTNTMENKLVDVEWNIGGGCYDTLHPFILGYFKLNPFLWFSICQIYNSEGHFKSDSSAQKSRLRIQCFFLTNSTALFVLYE